MQCLKYVIEFATIKIFSLFIYYYGGDRADEMVWQIIDIIYEQILPIEKGCMNLVTVIYNLRET